jgi:iron complex transport system permease protein
MPAKAEMSTEHLPLTLAIRHPDQQRTLQLIGLGVLVLLLVIAALLSVSLGAVTIPPSNILNALTGQGEARDELILWSIRLPRTAMAILIGAALAVSGTIMQGLFRNPLADPGLTGVSAGAALAAVCTIVLGQNAFGTIANTWLPLTAFAGGLATTMLLYAISTREGQTSVTTMLLAGIALAALAGAATGLLIFLASDQQLREFTFWTLGSLAGATWHKALLLAACVAATAPLWPWLARGLDKLALGEVEAAFAGLSVEKIKIAAIVLTALLTGLSVAATGIIGFIGLVVPHVLRLFAGPTHGFLLPASALLGGALLALADTASRLIATPAELPIGIVTACLGSPLFLWMLLRDRKLGGATL